MKNATKILALVLALTMVMTCFVGMMTTVSATEATEAPVPNAVIDFGDAATVDAIGQTNTAAVDEKLGYATLTAAGSDSWFVLNPSEETPVGGADVSGDQIDYVVIKYRTTSTAGGQFYWCYTDGTEWAENCPMFAWNGTDEWSYLIVDASAQWGTKTEGGLHSLRFDFFNNATGTVDVAYLKFFAEMADAEAYVAANTTTVTVPGQTVDAADVIWNGGTAYYVPSKCGTVTELTKVTDPEATATPTACPNAASSSGDEYGWTLKDGTTGTWATSAGQNALSGNGNKISVDTATYESVYFYGWTYLTDDNEDTTKEIVAFGYQIGDAEPVFDENSVILDEGLIGALGGNANARRHRITIPVSAMTSGMNNVVSLLAKDASDNVYCINQWGNGAIKFYVDIPDYTDAEGNAYIVTGNKAVSNDVEYKFYTNSVKYWAVDSTVVVPLTVVTANAPSDTPTNIYTTEPTGGGNIDCIDNGGVPNDGAENAIYTSVAGAFADAWLCQQDPINITDLTSLALEGWMRGDVEAVGYILDDDVNSIVWDSDSTSAVVYDEKLISDLGGANARRYKVHIRPENLTDGYHTIEPVCKMAGNETVYSLGWETFYVQVGAGETTYSFEDYTAYIVDAPVVIFYTATFVDKAGEIIAEVTYKEGTESIEAPAVPSIKGYDGFWKAYDMGADVTVTPYYVVNADLASVSAYVDVQLTVANGADAAVTVTDGNGNSATYTANADGVVTFKVLYCEGTATYSIAKDGYDAATGSITLTNDTTLTTATATLTETCKHANTKDANVTAATCTAAGSKDVVCADCGETVQAGVEIPATGHTAGAWETVTEATVGVAGKKVQKCTVCAAVVTEDTIPALEDAGTTETPAVTTGAPAGTTEAPAATTAAPAATTKARGGCGSVIGMSAAAVVLAAAAAAVALKKKED